MFYVRRCLLSIVFALTCGWVQANSSGGSENCATGSEVVYAFNPVTNVCSVFLNSCQVPAGWSITTAESCVMEHDFQIASSGLPSGIAGSSGETNAGQAGYAAGSGTTGDNPTGSALVGNSTSSGTTGAASGETNTMPLPDYSALVTTTVSAMSQWTSQLLNNLFAGMNGSSGASGSLYFPASGVLAIKCLRVSGIEDKVVDATLKQLPPVTGSSAILFSVVELTTADPASCGATAPVGNGGDPFLDLINRTQP